MITFQQLGKYGRLGNQMFQYATLYSLGKKLNYDVGVPYQSRSSNDKMDFCLSDGFEITAPDSSAKFSTSVYIEPHFNYDPNILNIPDGCDIRGYFQTEKYFKQHREDLKNKEFKFKQPIQDKVNSLLDGKDSDLISVHIRLGDYIHIQDCHPVCSVDYYKAAFEQLPKDAQIVLFSDDYAQALDLFKSFGINIMLTGGNDKFIDMCLMTKCEYHVIANSSFSWWGAWLSDSKKTIAPKQWFGSASHMPKNWDDIYSENWEII
jgi:hypothetical protein